MADKIEDYLKANGFTLHRQGKHVIYANEKGRTLSVSRSPSDFRHENNVIRDIKRAQRVSGLEFVGPFAASEKKEKPLTSTMPTPRPPFNPLPIEVPKPKIKVFDQEAKEIIFAGADQGKTAKEIAVFLTPLGYTDKDGEPVHFRHVQAVIANRASQLKAATAPPKVKEPTPRGPYKKKNNHSFIHDVSEIITSNLSDDMKEKFIVQLCQEHMK